jgi:predicted transcriptional regulator
MSEKTLTEGVRVPLSPATKRELEKLAKRDDRSVAAVVRRFIREGLEREDDGA